MNQKPIITLEDLEWAILNSPTLVSYYQGQVTVVSDLEKYYLYISQAGISTEIPLKINRGDRQLGLHPSTASKVGVCPLEVYYDCTGEVDAISKVDMKKQMTFDNGTMVHALLQQLFKEMYGDQFKDEVPISNNELRIHGHTDGIFSFSTYRFLLEIKTIKEGGNYGCEKVQKAPLPDHIRQVMFYMACADVPFALVLYLNKNNSSLIEHPVVFDPKLWEELKGFATPIVDAAYNGGQMVIGNVGAQCKYCKYSHGCVQYGQQK